MKGAPAWSLPRELALGHLCPLELRETDPAQPALPRPGEERLGPLVVRAVEPLPDGRGWRIIVQPMAPGTALIPPMDLGDGRRTPELRVTIPRTVPYQAPWMGVGGGREDLLPPVPFPWPYALPLLLPLAGLVWLAARRRREGAPARRRKAARKAFARRWPPAPDRESLDAAHAAGRELLAAFQGEEARSWGGEELEARGLEVWSRWVRSLDAARFARQEPSFPPLQALLAALERP